MLKILFVDELNLCSFFKRGMFTQFIEIDQSIHLLFFIYLFGWALQKFNQVPQLGIRLKHTAGILHPAHPLPRDHRSFPTGHIPQTTMYVSIQGQKQIILCLINESSWIIWDTTRRPTGKAMYLSLCLSLQEEGQVHPENQQPDINYIVPKEMFLLP